MMNDYMVGWDTVALTVPYLQRKEGAGAARQYAEAVAGEAHASDYDRGRVDAALAALGIGDTDGANTGEDWPECADAHGHVCGDCEACVF